MGYRRRIFARPIFQLIRALSIVGVAAAAVSCSGGDEGAEVIDLTDSSIGTCLDFGDSIDAEITKLPVVPCGEPHSHEIYAVEIYVVENTATASYPGLEALEAEAQTRCLGAFEEYVGISAFDSELFFSWLVPTLNSWDRDDDRQIVCVIGEGNGAPLVGTVRKLAR